MDPVRPVAAAMADSEGTTWEASTEDKRRQASPEREPGTEGSTPPGGAKEAENDGPVDGDGDRGSASTPQVIGAPVTDGGAEVKPVVEAHGTAISRASVAPVTAGAEGTNGAPPVSANSSSGGSGGSGGKDSSANERVEAPTLKAVAGVAAEALLVTSSERSSSPSMPPSAHPASTTKPVEANGTVSSPPHPLAEKPEPAPKSESALVETPGAGGAAAVARPPRLETGAVVSGWHRSPTASPSASRGRESGSKTPNAKLKPRATVSPKRGSAGSTTSSSGGGGGGSRRKGGGEVSKRDEADAAKEKKEPRIKVPRPELLGAVVARLAVRRDLPDEEYAEIEGDFLWDEDDGDGDDMSESDGEEGAEERQDGGSICEAKEERRRRRRMSKRRGGEATVVREAVVFTFDGAEGLYVLVNTHEEEEKLSLEELEVALHQSQVRPPPLPPSLRFLIYYSHISLYPFFSNFSFTRKRLHHLFRFRTG